MLSYSKKKLKFILRLYEGTFTSTGTNTLELLGFRSSVNIEKAGGMQFSTAEIQIFGIPQADMNEITTLIWTKNKVNQNSVEVYALDDNNSYNAFIFGGDIIQAWGNYEGMPNVYLYIQANNAFYDTLRYLPPSSFKGSTDVATVIGSIAKQLGYSFENTGVNKRISNLYIAGTGIKQIQEIANIANIDLYIDNKIIAICNQGKTRGGFDVVLNQGSGMVGYPGIDGLGVNVLALFNPEIVFGGGLKVESTITRANGNWAITSLSYFLQSEMPNGSFFVNVRGTKDGFAVY